MMAEFQKNKNTTVYQQFEDFLQRFRGKIAPNHKLKSTNRLQIETRYPEYKDIQESTETKHKVPLDTCKIINQKFDNELLDKFKNFFAYLKKILKGS